MTWDLFLAQPFPTQALIVTAVALVVLAVVAAAIIFGPDLFDDTGR